MTLHADDIFLSIKLQKSSSLPAHLLSVIRCRWIVATVDTTSRSHLRANELVRTILYDR